MRLLNTNQKTNNPPNTFAYSYWPLIRDCFAIVNVSDFFEVQKTKIMMKFLIEGFSSVYEISKEVSIVVNEFLN